MLFIKQDYLFRGVATSFSIFEYLMWCCGSIGGSFCIPKKEFFSFFFLLYNVVYMHTQTCTSCIGLLLLCTWDAFPILFAPILCMCCCRWKGEPVGFNFRSISDIGNFLLVKTLFLERKNFIKASQPSPKNNNKKSRGVYIKRQKGGMWFIKRALVWTLLQKKKAENNKRFGGGREFWPASVF